MWKTHLDRRLDRLRLNGVGLPHAVVVHVDQLATLAVHAPRRVAVDGVLGLESSTNKLIEWNVASQKRSSLTYGRIFFQHVPITSHSLSTHACRKTTN